MLKSCRKYHQAVSVLEIGGAGMNLLVTITLLIIIVWGFPLVVLFRKIYKELKLCKKITSKK
jgi:hypothetical protein